MQSKQDYRRIAALAWPVLVGQLAVMANGVIDTVMAGRTSPTDVAAVGLGASIYATVYVTFMGVVLALSPVVAQHVGAGRHERIGIDFMQGLWLAGLLSLPGCVALGWTDPWLTLSAPPPEVAERTRLYLWAVAAGLPGALLFRVFYALNNALARPKAVMAINLLGVALKLPLNAVFIDGWQPGWLPVALHVPTLGGPGCGVATAVVAWASAITGFAMLVLDRAYRRYGLFASWRPSLPALKELLRLGLPIGAAYVVDVTAFTFMALFVARFGATVGASHQITSNIVVVLFMVALAIANATSVLVAQSVGAGEHRQARRMVHAGARMTLACAVSLACALWLLRGPVAALYTTDETVLAAAMPLLAIAAVYHVFDATQAFLVNVLRAYKIVTQPTLVYVVALWGVGLAGGWWLTFAGPAEGALSALAGDHGGAMGFWTAAVCSVAAASIGMAALLARLWRSPIARPPEPADNRGG